MTPIRPVDYDVRSCPDHILEGREIMTKRGLAALLAIFVGVLFPTACLRTSHDVHVQLDVRHVRRASQEIEKAVARPAAQTGESLRNLGTAEPARPALAPLILTPAMERALEDRRERHPFLQHFKSLGLMGENSSGMLETRQSPHLEKPEVRRKIEETIIAENQARSVLYREIAAQTTSTETDSLAQVSEVWAETLRSQASPGDWIQAPLSETSAQEFLKSEMGRSLFSAPEPGGWFRLPGEPGGHP
ncbi:DUF1318 domain-containing protein [bacterium]|nr:DUF1318 domain-containing protein [bacterium]